MIDVIHKSIKQMYSEQGYLEYYPYHLISDEEMCDAFLHYTDYETFKDDDTVSFFKDNYPLLDDSLENDYINLIEKIQQEIDYFKSNLDDNRRLPDWVYSYMLGVVISINSEKYDIHDLLVALDEDNIDDEFTAAAQSKCLEVSKIALNSSDIERPFGLFGEPHILKYLRLNPLVK